MKNIYKNAEMHSVDLFYNLRLVSLAVLMACLSMTATVRAQNAIVGTGFTSGWGGSCGSSSGFVYFSNGAGSSQIGTYTANGTGNQYWRMALSYGATTGQYCVTPGTDVNVQPNTTYLPSTTCTTSGSQYYSVPSTSYHYVFKSSSVSSISNCVFFEVQGTVQSVSSVTQSPASTSVNINQPVVVTATMSGSLSKGQAVYLRYTTNGYTTSTVVAMTGSGTTYTATIPGNAASTNVSYYVFTSGTSTGTAGVGAVTAPGSGAGVYNDGSNADLYTINLNNNSGSNYSYTVGTSYLTYTSVAAGGNWSAPGTWVGSAVPISASYVNIIIAPNSGTGVVFNQSAIANTVSIQPGATLTLNKNVDNLTATTVNDTGTVTIAAAAATANLFQVTNWNVLNGGVFTNNAGLASALAVTNFNVANGGTYTHNATSSNANGLAADFPGGSGSITMGATSLTKITYWGAGGVSTPLAPLPAHVIWGNLTINVASNNYPWSQQGAIDSIQGNFTQTSVGGNFAFVLDSLTSPTVFIGGNLTVSAGYFSLINGAAASASPTLNVAGNVSMTGGQIRVSSSTAATSTATMNITGTTSTYTQSAGILQLVFGTTGSANFNMTGSGSSFTISGGSCYFNNGTTGIGIMTLAGAFNLSGGIMDLNFTGNNGKAGTLNVAGNFTLSGSSILRTSVTNSAANNGKVIFNGTTQSLNATGWSGGASDSVAYVINSGSTVTLGSNFTFNSNTVNTFNSFTVNSGGTLNFGTYHLNDGSGYGVFVNNGTLIIGDPNGINATGSSTGNVQVGASGGSATYNATATCNYTYAGSSAQLTGTGLPASLAGTLTISNSAGVTLSQATTVTGASSALAFTAGLLSLSNFNLTLGSTATLSGYGSSSYIQTNGTGQFKQTLPITTQVLFPVGNAAYDPFWMTCTGTAGVYGIICNNSIVPTINNPNEVVNRSWTIYETTTGGVITPKAQWNSPAEEASGFAAGTTPYFAMYNGSAWLVNAATLSSPTMTASTGFTIPAINTAYIFAIGKDNGFNTPAITLSDPSPVAAGNITQGTTNNLIGAFALTVTSNGNDTLTGMTVATTGTYNATDLTNIKLWYQSSSTFNAGTATLLSTITSPATTGTQTFPSFTNQALANGTIAYFFITTDVACATIANTVQITVPTSTNFTFSQTPSAFSGTGSANGLQTIVASTPVNVTSPAASPASTTASLSWTAPTGCYTGVMIVVSPAANTGGTPTGNGSAYTANLAYTSGTAFGNGYVVYKGTSSPQTVTGLTAGATYYAKFFTWNGTLWTAGTEISFTTENIAISSSNPSVLAASITQGTTNNVIGAFTLTTTGYNNTLTGMTLATTGTYLATDLTNIKLWYQTTSTFNAGTATLLSTITSPATAGTQTFPSFTSQLLTSGATGYFFITTDLACGTIGKTIKTTAPSSSNFTFSMTPLSFTGTAFNSGAQTIAASTPVNVTSPAASPSTSTVSLSWTAPTGCYTGVMIVVSPAANTGGTPTGNGSAYTANLAYASGTAFGNGYVVYKGTSSPETVTGLTPGNTYYAKFFTWNGSVWTAGTEINFILASTTNNTWVGGTSNDWGTASNWSLLRVPLSTDSVVIAVASPNPCVINSSSYTCVNLTIAGTGNFQMASGTTLTVNGTFSMTSSTSPTLNCGSTINLASTSSITVPAINYGNLNLTGGDRILASSGTIGVCGTYTPGSGTFTNTGSTINYNGTGAQTVTAFTYNNLTISGARTTNSVTLDNTGTATIDIAGTFSPTMTFTTGAIINTGDTINFSSASSQPMPAFYYGSVLNHQVGNTFANAGGARIWASSGVIDINALFVPSTGTNTITGSIVRYSSSTGINTYPLVNVNSNIAGYDYNYLSFSGSDQWYQAPGVNLGVYADDSISGTGIQLVNNSASGDSLKVNGNLIVNGNFTITGNSGSGVANIAGNVTVTSTPGSITIGSGTTTGGILNVTGTSSTFTNTGNIFVLSGSAGAGTLNMTGTSSSFSQTGNGVLYMNAGTSASAEPLVKFAGSVTLNSTNINWNSVLTNTGRGGSIYVGGDFTVGSGSEITFGQAQYSNGVIHFNGKSPQNISCTTKPYVRRVTFVIDSGSYCTLANNFHIQSYNATGQNDSFIVSAGATLNCGIFYISDTTTGRGTFINNGTLIIGDPNGINPTGATTGNIRVGGGGTIPGTAVYNNTSTCNYTYQGTTLQSTGTGLPSTLSGNLTINNSAGVQLAKSVTLNDSLKMLSGNLDLNGSFNITLGTTAILYGEGCSNSIVNTGSATTGNGYIGTTRTLGAYAGNVGNIGITLYNTGSLGSTLIKRFPAKSITAINTSYNSLSRIYEVKPTTASSGKVTVSYCDADLNGNTESNPNLGVYSNSTASNETSTYASGYAANYETAFDGSADTVLSASPAVTFSTTGTYITAADIDQYCTVSAGDWNVGTTWSGGIVPPANANICISNAVTVSQASTATTGNVTIYTGGSLTISSAYTVNIGTGKTFTNNGSTASLGATGNVSFLGAGTIAGSLASTFGNMLVNGGMTLTTVPTISDTLRINNGGYFNQPPIYGSSSFLVYNIVSSSYTVNNEWSANGSTAGTGIPQNVIIQNGTTLNMPTTSRGLAGNLYISSGTLALNSTSGDIYVAGNWTRNSSATFTPNGRAVFFDGTGTQVVTVTGGGTETFNYLFVNGSGTMQLSSSPATNVTVNSSGGLTLGSSNSTSTIDLNGQTLTLSGGGNLSLSSGNRYITSTITGGIMKITSSSVATSSYGTLTFQTGTTLQLLNGFNFGWTGSAGVTTINGTLEIDGGGYGNTYAPIYGTNSLLNYNGVTSYTAGQEWYQNTYSEPGVPYNVTISNSGSVNFTGEGYQHELWGNLTISSGSSLSLAASGSTPSPDLYIKGNWINSGTFSCNGHLVQFLGLTAQTLTGATTFDYLQMNNSRGLTLNNDATVNTQLILTSGVITTGSNKVAVLSTSSSSITGNSASSYINGNIRRYVTASGNYDLPVGTASNYQLANITFNSSLSGTTTYLDAKFNNATPIAPVPTTCVINNGKIGAVLPQGSWTIIPDVEPNSGATYTATLNMTGVSSGLPSSYVDAHGHTILPQDQIGLVKKDATINSGNWTGCGLMSGVTQPYGTQIQSTQSTTSNTATVVRSGIPSFSDFAIGVQQNQNWALPVQLIYFAAVNDNNNAALTWATASEVNNAYFEIDRSTDGVTFDSIGQVAGHGNSEVTINYAYSDPNISLYNSPILYYRLKQVDVDGNFTYSNIAAINVADLQQVFQIISTYPNPFSDHFSVSFFSPASQAVKMSMYDVRGALVSDETINAEIGMNVYTLPNPSHWASGFYSINVNTGSQKYTVKMLKTE